VALFTQGDGAWARDANTDLEVVAALKQGKSATVKGTSAKGTATTDTFALAGFGDALAAAMKACSVKSAP
jgi:invasion protein IalB